MPAFMIISGYLFGLSKKTNAINVIKNKINHLLIPIFTWAILTTIIFAIKEETFNFLTIIKKYIHTSIYSLWFLWAVFYSTTVSIIIKVHFNNNIYIHFLLIIVSFFIPDSLNLGLYKFVYPFFILGYYFHNIKDFIFKHKRTILLISTIIFIILLFIYNKDSYIYTTGHFITSYYQLYIDIYRYIIGVFGSCCVFMWIYYLKKYFYRKNSIISYIGQKTMGIYIISDYINLILTKLTKDLQSFNLIYLTIETCVTIVLSLIIIKCVEQNVLLKKYLLGS